MKWIKVFKSVDDANKAIEEGKARRINYKGQLIAIVRNKGEYFAIEDTCPHKGAPLSKGWVNAHGDLLCPLHNYCYNLNTGRELNQLTQDARVYQVKIEEGGLYVDVESVS